MTKRIFRSILLAATAVLLACLVLIMGVLYDYFTSVQKEMLQAQLSLAAQGAQREGLSYFDGLDTGGYRFTWIAADGTVLFDSEAEAASMENHADREEVHEALSFGVGESERTSETLTRKTLYRAQRLPDGTVLRAAVTQYTIVTLVYGMLQPIIVVLVAAVALSGVLARRMSKRIVGPLNSLNLENPLENESYEELAPLLTRIEQQHKLIQGQLRELQRKQDEFTSITTGMSEGLLLLNQKGVILTINPAAQKLFAVGLDCVGRDFLTVDRSLAMQKLIFAAQTGQQGQAAMEVPAGMIQIHASPVLSEGQVVGICVLTFDITEKAHLEQLRREFSANVSHELKTPLHSIMGSAELIENGLVKPDDLPQFGGQIRREASRLVLLIDDIIRLSQLDEEIQMPQEEVDLAALAAEAAESLRESAAARNISVQVEGSCGPVSGVRRLLYELIFNLCDNAVKYNVDGGQVKVTLSREGDKAVLSVSDTGIGIPREAQSRVFERFFRVDKSHFKETGGTGLGLSIVKHAARYHKAVIQLDSELGKGTRVRVLFPAV